MGFMTLEDYREEVNLGLGDRRQSGNRRLDSWINRAYFEVAFKTEQEWMKICNYFTTVKGQPSYALPGDFFTMISIADLDNKNRLTKLHLTEYHRVDRDNEGLPKRWARRRDTLFLAPTPGGEYRMELYYYWNPPKLTQPGDLSRMAHFFDHAILLLALRNAWMTIEGNDSQKATFYFQAAVNYLREMDSETGWEGEQPMEGITVATEQADLHEMR